MVFSVRKRARKRNGKTVRDRFYTGFYSLVHGGREYSVPLGVNDKALALKLLRRHVDEQQRVRLGELAPAAVRAAKAAPLARQIEDFCADLAVRGRVKLYVTNSRGRLEAVAAACGWARLEDVSTQGFEQWRQANAKLSQKWLNETLARWRQFMTWGQEAGRLEANPLAKVRKVEGRGASYERAAMTEEQMRRLLAVSGPRKGLYLAAMTTGLRRGELGQLVWADVYLQAGGEAIRVRASVSKNRKEALQPVCPELAEVLAEMRAAGVRDGDRVFPRLHRMKEFYPDLAAAGIPKVDDLGRPMHFHSLRHSFNTWLLQRGEGQRTVQALMRHSDPRLSAGRYLDARQLPTRQAVVALPRLLAGGTAVGTGEIVARGRAVAQVGGASTGEAVPQVVATEAIRRVVAEDDANCRGKEMAPHSIARQPRASRLWHFSWRTAESV